MTYTPAEVKNGTGWIKGIEFVNALVARRALARLRDDDRNSVRDAIEILRIALELDNNYEATK